MASKAPDYTINYDDPRLKSVKAEEKAAINDVDKTYGEMIDGTDAFYDKQIEAAKNYGDQQTKIQNEALDLTIQGIEQNKAELKEDYTKEQSGAYVDWQKQSGAYGVNAEKMAAAGLAGSGYSESSQVSMYNTYQNRVSAAWQTYVSAKKDYDLAIAEARNQNSSILAQIAYNTLQTTLQLSLEGFQYKNSLIMDLANKKMQIKDSYYTRYQGVLDQINKENTVKRETAQATVSSLIEAGIMPSDEQIKAAGMSKKEVAKLVKHNKAQNDSKTSATAKSDAQKVVYASIDAGVMPSDADIKAAGLDKTWVKNMVAAVKGSKGGVKVDPVKDGEDKKKVKKDGEDKKKVKNDDEGDSKSPKTGHENIPSGKNSAVSDSASKPKGAKNPGTSKTTKGKATSSAVPIEMSSVLALGYGKLTAKQLSDLEDEGKVVSVVKNGKRYFNHNTDYLVNRSKKGLLP